MGKPAYRVAKPRAASKAATTAGASRRKSAQLQHTNSKADSLHEFTALICQGQQQQLPSPTLSEIDRGTRSGSRRRKRKSTAPEGSETCRPSKAPKLISKSSPEPKAKEREERREEREDNPVTHWVITGQWPRFTTRQQQPVTMSESNLTSSKRKSESTHRSWQIERMAANGVFMKSSALLQKSSKELCARYLQGERMPNERFHLPLEKISAVLERVEASNEGRIFRDVTPLIVPSAENLFYRGEPIPDWIGDEVLAPWSRCSAMGSTYPKPDYTAGLLRKAFTSSEFQTLCNYSSPLRPFLFTPDLAFPFLICEAKNGEEGLNKANRQNIHSGSIAVRAIIDLHRAAFGKSEPKRVTDLYGQILAFTISHNHNTAYICGNFAVAADDYDASAAAVPPATAQLSPFPGEKLQFYRHEIALFSLTMFDGQDRYKAYNFVQNVYEHFAPVHLQRIKAATASLMRTGTSALDNERTGLSFSTSDMALDEAASAESQADAMSASSTQRQSQQQQQDENHGEFRVPGEPASAARTRNTLSQLRAQVDRERQDMEKLQGERDGMKELVDSLTKQLEQQRKDMQQQMELQNEIITMLKDKASSERHD